MYNYCPLKARKCEKVTSQNGRSKPALDPKSGILIMCIPIITFLEFVEVFELISGRG